MFEQDYLNHVSLPAKLCDEIERNVARLFLISNVNRYPVDPMQIAHERGYDLVPFTQMPKEVKSELIFKDIDGISHYDPERNKFVVYYRRSGTEERLRFTIGHEIGHIRMNHRHESELARRIADYYSAYMLAPTPWIGHAGCKDYTDVAKTFFLSDPCAKICFERYKRRSKLPYTKKHEETLLWLLS